MENKFKNYGDVNPLDHGGIWVKQINNHTFEVIRNIPETNEVYNMEVDITDSWIEKEEVLSFTGMTEENFDPIWYAFSCTQYYGVENFGNSYEYKSRNEVIDHLINLGIEDEYFEKYFLVSKTYEIITPESLKQGDAEDRGFEYEDDEMSIEDILREINNDGFTELSSSWIEDHKDSPLENYTWINTVDPERNYTTGEETYYGLHIKCKQKEFYDICKKAKLIK